MPIEDDDDRAVFFDPDEFGVSVVWQPPGSAFTGLFSRPSVMTAVDGDAPALVDRMATVLCRESDLPAGAGEGDPVSIGPEAAAYLCRSIKPDGTGLVSITLQRARENKDGTLDFEVPDNSDYIPLA